MLAQNFLTAAQLRTSERKLEAAIKLLGMLERGEVTFAKPNMLLAPGCYINMKYWWSSGASSEDPMSLVQECGTFGCVGGWIEYLAGEKFTGAERQRMFDRDRWYNLFHPPGFASNPENYPPERIAQALRSLLTTGHPDWSL